MFLSCYKPKDMEKMTLDDLVYIVGLEVDKVIIKPPKCKVDGDYVYIDTDTGYYQCSYCDRFGRIYIGDSLDDFSTWRALDVKYFK
jgi:hypothetical protein